MRMNHEETGRALAAVGFGCGALIFLVAQMWAFAGLWVAAAVLLCMRPDVAQVALGSRALAARRDTAEDTAISYAKAVRISTSKDITRIEARVAALEYADALRWRSREPMRGRR